MPTLSRHSMPHLAVCLIVWVVTAFYLISFLENGWIPSDEGLLAHSAERVLEGELPHADFGDMYTGGLAFLHALAFQVFGVRLGSLRLLLYLATLLAVPLIYLLAARRAPPWLAGAATLTCVVWTVPNYFASMPSWYNLFLTLAALAALHAHIDDGRRRWLVLAGVFTGFSFLIKSSALLLIAAVFLFLLYREMELARPDGKVANLEALTPPSPWQLFITTGLLFFLAVLIRFISMMPAVAEFLVFVGPSACLCAVLIAGARHPTANGFGTRFARLMGLALPYLGGVLLPCLLFLVPYLLRGQAEALFSGAYLFVGKRLDFTTYALPPAPTLLFAVPVLILLLWPLRRPFSPLWERRLLAPLGLVLVVFLALAPLRLVYQYLWFSFRPLPLAAVLAGSLFLAFRRETISSARRQHLFLILAVLAVISVLQFPYALGIYYCYIAPLVVLALLELVRTQEGAPRRLHAALLMFFALFGALWMNLGWTTTHGVMFYAKEMNTRLEMPRAELWVSEEEENSYRQVVEWVRKSTAEGAAIYAAPDCPEIYFLSQRRNPTPSFYDYFEEDFGTPQRAPRLLRMLDEEKIEMVVLHRRAYFSGPVDPEFERGVAERFPRRVEIPPRFTLYLREPATP